MKQLTIKDRIRAIYFAVSFCLFLGLDMEYTSTLWVIILAVNFAISVAIVNKINFNHTNN